MGFLYYNEVDKSSGKSYPDWDGAKPNLETFLNALNLSQPIIGSQFELMYSRWPRTTFFAKNISVPGITTNTIEINHAGFTIPIPTHVKYESTEITMTIIADKEGFHYYDWRNMVLQSGHPLIAGDPRSMIGWYDKDTNEDYLEVRLRNKVSDRTHHHWIIHNFRPIGIGEIELSHDSSSFVEFEITGTFTHVTYMTGDDQTSNQKSQEISEQNNPDENPSNNNDVPVEFTDGTTPDDIGQPDTEPTPDPQPDPEPPKPTPLDIMSGSHKLETNSNEDSSTRYFSSSLSRIHFVDGENTSQETIEAAQSCSDELNKAKEMYEEKMKAIAEDKDNYPPDPGYQSEDEDGNYSEEKLVKVETPTKEQEQARKDAEQKHFEGLSMIGSVAKDIGEASPNSSKSEIMSMIKDKLQQQGVSGYYDSQEKLENDAKAAYKEYENAKIAAAKDSPYDKVTMSISQDRTCTSKKQRDAYEQATREYLDACKKTMNDYKAKKSNIESN